VQSQERLALHKQEPAITLGMSETDGRHLSEWPPAKDNYQ
jgi:hypothetical protein